MFDIQGAVMICRWQAHSSGIRSAMPQSSRLGLIQNMNFFFFFWLLNFPAFSVRALLCSAMPIVTPAASSSQELSK